MPKIARLSDVDVQAVSLVRKGANRQRFFLRKSDGAVVTEADPMDSPAETFAQLFETPSVEDAVFAKADWSAVYCVVAAPGVREGAGMLAEADDPDDEWASEDEIRKAAHAFMRNGGLINKMHADLEPFGQVVENAIALADLDVEGHVIAKGSWYLAIEPTAEGRDLIEKGEFTGVSLQGTGKRVVVEVEKADPKAQGSKGSDRAGAKSYQTCPGCKGKVAKGVKACPNCGKKLSGSTGMNVVAKARTPLPDKPGTNYVEQAGGFPKPLKALIEELYDGTNESKAVAQGISVMRKYAAGKAAHGTGTISAEKAAKWAAVLAEYEALPAKARAKTIKKEHAMPGRFMQAIGKALGIDPTDFDDEPVEDDDELSDDEIRKAMALATFSSRMAARELDEEMPMAFDVLRSTFYDSVHPFIYGWTDAPSPADSRAALDRSLAEFHAWALATLDSVTGDTAIAKQDDLRAQMRTLKENLPSGMTTTTEDDDDMPDPTKIEKLESDIEALQKSVGDLVSGLAPVIAKAAEEAAPAPTTEDVLAKMGEIEKSQSDLAAMVEKLGAGGTSQPAGTPVQKSDDPLAGLLS